MDGIFFIEAACQATVVSRFPVLKERVKNWENREGVCTYGFCFVKVNVTTSKGIEEYMSSFCWDIKSGDYIH
jgi:hypothetical protein